jgi:hypothetical protein
MTPGPFHNLKTVKRAMNSRLFTTDMTQKSRRHVFKFLKPLTPSMENIVK